MASTRAERWSGASQLPLLVVSLLFVVAYAWSILSPGLDPTWSRLCTASSPSA